MAGPGQFSSLAQAVRGPVLGKYVGQLGLVLAALQAVPLATSLLYGELRFSAAYAAVAALLALACIPLARTRVTTRIQINEALVVTALIFLLGGLVNVPAFLLAGLAPVDALFESVSGVTTTGLTIVAGAQELPATIKIARGWSQWYGGLGIVVMSLALLAGHDVASRRLLGSDAGLEKLTVSARGYARRALLTYTLLTFAGVVVLLLLGVPALDAFGHVFSAVSTGGFSTHDDSLGAFGAWPAGVLTLLSLAGAIALPVFYLATIRDWGRMLRDVEVRALLLLCAVSAVVVAAFLGLGAGLAPGDAIYHGALLAVSAQTTTGYSTLPLRGLPDGLLLWLCFAMLAGGGLGSTAGGIKLLRILVAGRLLVAMLRRTALPGNAVMARAWAGRKLQEQEAERMLLLILLFFVVVALAWLSFLMHGYEPMPALFEVVSATATVGLSTGLTGGLPDTLKLVLCAVMLAGRLEIVALLVLLSPGTWFNRRSESR